MPGSSKVNGVWKTATGLSVKVSGQWKTATSAFIKVGGQWKQWFASKIQDAFNRASTVSGLGTADSGQIWNALRGNWRISGSNTALSDDSASSYPIASVNFGNTDVKVQTDTSGGVGIAFWVSDSGSWWAAVPRYYTSTYQYGICNAGQQSCIGAGCTPSPNCCSGVSQSSSSSCDNTPATCNGSGCTPSGCCGTVSYSGGACDQGYQTGRANTSGCCGGITSQGGGTTSVCDQNPQTCGSENLNCSGSPCCSGAFISSYGGTSYICDQSQVTNTNNPPAGNCCSGVTSSGGGSSTVCDAGTFNCGTNSACNGASPPCCGPVVSVPGGQSSSCTGGKTDVYSFSDCSSLGGNCAAGPFTETVNSSYCGAPQFSSTDYFTALYACCELPYSTTDYVCPSGQYYGSWYDNPFGCYTYSPLYGGFYTYQGPATSVTTYTCNTQNTPFSYTNYYCYTSLVTVNNPTTYYCYNQTRVVPNPTNYSCYTSTRAVTTPDVYSCYTSTRLVNVPVTYSCYTSNSPIVGTCFTGSTTTITRSCFTSNTTYTGTDYNTELAVLSSVSGVVVTASTTTLNTNSGGYSTVGSIYVSTSGNAISVTAYSGSNLSGTNMGTLTHTPSSPTKGTSVGIIKAPSGNQGSTTDNFLATI